MLQCQRSLWRAMRFRTEARLQAWWGVVCYPTLLFLLLPFPTIVEMYPTICLNFSFVVLLFDMMTVVPIHTFMCVRNFIDLSDLYNKLKLANVISHHAIEHFVCVRVEPLV